LACIVFYGALPDSSQENVLGVLALQMDFGRKGMEMGEIFSPEGGLPHKYYIRKES